MKTGYLFILLLAIGTAIPIKAQEPFSIRVNEIILDFDFYKGKNLRLRTILPASFQKKVSLENLEADNDAEVFLHITGENRKSFYCRLET